MLRPPGKGNGGSPTQGVGQKGKERSQKVIAKKQPRKDSNSVAKLKPPRRANQSPEQTRKPPNRNAERVLNEVILFEVCILSVSDSLN